MRTSDPVRKRHPRGHEFGLCRRETDVLFDVFLTLVEGGLSELGCNLGGGIVHELAVGAEDVPACAALLLIRIPRRVASIALLLRLGTPGRRRRRPKLRHGRDVLRDGVM